MLAQNKLLNAVNTAFIHLYCRISVDLGQSEVAQSCSTSYQAARMTSAAAGRRCGSVLIRSGTARGVIRHIVSGTGSGIARNRARIVLSCTLVAGDVALWVRGTCGEQLDK